MRRCACFSLTATPKRLEYSLTKPLLYQCFGARSERLPQGWNQVVGRPRAADYRAVSDTLKHWPGVILQRPRILILDEATSALECGNGESSS